jgi:hypothetical protein
MAMESDDPRYKWGATVNASEETKLNMRLQQITGRDQSNEASPASSSYQTVEWVKGSNNDKWVWYDYTFDVRTMSDRTEYIAMSGPGWKTTGGDGKTQYKFHIE